MNVGTQEIRLDCASLNMNINETTSNTTNTTLPPSIPSYNSQPIPSVEPILLGSSIPTEQNINPIMEQSEHDETENPMDIIMEVESSERSGMQPQPNQISEEYPFHPNILYVNGEIHPSGILPVPRERQPQQRLPESLDSLGSGPVGTIEVTEPEQEVPMESMPPMPPMPPMASMTPMAPMAPMESLRHMESVESQECASQSGEYCKRPRTAYNYFSKDYFVKLKNQDSTRPSTDIIKEISTKWKMLSEEEKRPYVEISKKDRDRYTTEYSDMVSKKEQAGIPNLSKTREKQSYIFEALEKRDSNSFVTGLLLCNGDNKQKAINLMQQVRIHLIQMMKSQSDRNRGTIYDQSIYYPPLPYQFQINPPYQHEILNPPYQQFPPEKPIHHEEEKKYVCDREGCHQSFATASGLYKHRQKHNNPHVIYTCTVEGCNKQFKTKYGLTLHHNNKHLNEKPFTCAICNQGFVRKSDLELHKIRKHSEEKRFRCDECHKSFASQFELNRHKKIH